nr:uncharacterized protein LOC111509166 [Leptinotarsa decemlineata]
MSPVNSICRLCLQKEETISKFNIFDLGLSDSLYWIFGVEIDVGDFFSKLICHKCLNIVKYVQRVQKQFQTNQYILRERICPKDYDVESANATKDVSTSTDHEPANDRLSLSMSTLFMLNRPYVSVEKLEESDISKYWKKIGKSTYRIRKQSGLKEMVSGEVAAVQRISVPIDVFSSFPSLEIPKADDIYGLEGYEKINDTLYKELPKQSQLTAEERENNSEKQAHCDMISVPTNTFDLFSSPYVEVSRIDQIFREEGFKKIGEFIYKKIPSSLGKPIIERDSSNKKQYNCQPPSNKIRVSLLRKQLYQYLS